MSDDEYFNSSENNSEIVDVIADEDNNDEFIEDKEINQINTNKFNKALIIEQVY